jgi:AraC-like DNA-binding protein
MDKAKIEFKLGKKVSFLEAVHHVLGGTLLNEHTLHFPDDHPVLSGTMQRHIYDEGLRLVVCQSMEIKKPIELAHIPEENNDFLLIHTYLSDEPIIQQIAETGEKGALMRLNEGLFFNSSRLRYTQQYPVGTKFSFFAINFEKRWMENYLQPKPDEFTYRMVHSEKTYAFYETMNAEIMSVAEQICSMKVENALEKLEFDNKVLSFSLLCLKKLEQRQHKTPIVNMNRNDLVALFRVRQILLDNIAHPPTIPDLAKNAAMSESKLKTYFKQVYGDSIYQHCLKHRMEIAYTLLARRSASVKEISDQLGYVNPSQFTKKFKEHFKSLPTDVLKSSF